MISVSIDRHHRSALAVAFTLLSTLAAGSVQAEVTISRERILGHTTVLASDEFEGRAPGSPGEEKTVAYLTNQFRELGLAPGNPDGTFVQRVPLVGITSRPSLTFDVNGQPFPVEHLNDFVGPTSRVAPHVAVRDSEAVFVGYGIVAPEFGWDDFKNVDVRGKTVVVLVNDPPVLDPQTGQLDPKFFGGRAMTYYGRWTYKYEIAAARGAAACLIVHETGPASYPFAVITGSRARENFELRTPGGNADRVAMEGWLTHDAARRLFAAGGHDYEALKKAAARPDFQPVALGAKASFTIQSDLREVDSQNVVARLPGSDPALREEHIIYTAHWDHLGRDSRLSGDQIFNGAADNAGGVAVLLEIARAFASLPPEQRPKRSLLFLAVTAEEKGLLGSRFYAEHPLYPLTRTLANLTLDGVNQFGPTSDLTVIGSGAST
ncbi:MAG TPA: M28 family peptidase, partial [Opitutus sp.]|nr:M28 family peptidase [Opitutus sp.]